MKISHKASDKTDISEPDVSEVYLAVYVLFHYGRVSYFTLQPMGIV